MKVFSVSGYSNTGKTTTIAAIISLLNKKSYKVAAIKDIHYEKFTMETEGSDSYKMHQAGAKEIFARGMKETFLIRPEQMPLTEMLSLLNADWVVVEGMKKEALPRIVTAESIEQLDELVDDTVMAISGKISTQLTEYKGLPVINSVKQPELLVQIIADKVFNVLPLAKKECCCGLSCYQMVGEILAGRKKRSDCVIGVKEKVYMKIEGNEIKMVPFVSNVLYDMIYAFAGNLKGFKKGKIELTLTPTEDD